MGGRFGPIVADSNYQKPEDLIGENGLLKQLTKLLVEKALDAEMIEHLGSDVRFRLRLGCSDLLAK